MTADVESVGAITIPARKLSEIARELPPAPVRISATGDQRITLECGRSKFKLLGLPKDEFPQLPGGAVRQGWRVPSGDLQQLIQHTAFAASTEESRPILNGVLWELKPDLMRMVATNGHRLAKMEVAVNGQGAEGSDLIVIARRPSTRSADSSPPRRSSRWRRETTTSASARRSPRSSRASSKGRIRTTSRSSRRTTTSTPSSTRQRSPAHSSA
ncbi:MAG: DNA polymerase III subunit beta [Gemmatimonadaceae bacterium]|nr:DNA polymerase III subunit beta [Gemmatimonadaceae bacterium]